MAKSRRHQQHFRRILLKLSGEAFCHSDGFGVDPDALDQIAREIASAHGSGVQMAVVVGGGNIIRGASLAKQGVVHQATADYMGMLGTVINGMALKEGLERAGKEARCMTAIDIPAVAEPFIRLRAIRHMDLGRIVVLAGGTGNPFFTTDTCAALRATELECDAVLKATKVDGVYTADPNKDPKAELFDTLTFDDALNRKLEVMDRTALTMCHDRGIDIIVFNYRDEGAIARVVGGAPLGTSVTRTSD